MLDRTHALANELREISLRFVAEASALKASDGLPVKWELISPDGISCTVLAGSMAECAQIILSFDVDENTFLQSLINRFESYIIECTKNIVNLNSLVIDNSNNSGGISHIEPSSGSIILLNSSVIALIDQITPAIRARDDLVMRLAEILPFSNTRSKKNSRHSESLEHLVKQASMLSKSTRETATKIDNDAREVAESITKISQSCSNAAASESQAKSYLESINQLLGKGQELNGQVQAVLARSQELDGQIAASRTNLSEFETSFNAHMANSKTAQDETARVQEGLNQSKKMIEQLIKQSEEMITGSTVAGLAHIFGQMNENLTKNVDWARRTIYILTALTVIAALPLALPALIPAFGWIKSFINDPITKPLAPAIIPEIRDGFSLAVYLVARGGLIIPFAVLLAFSIARHNALFRLREHYAFKYSIAMSVEGFKKQSPTYEQEIAAMALDLIAFNPAEKLRGQSAHDTRFGRTFRLWRDKLVSNAEKKMNDPVGEKERIP